MRLINDREVKPELPETNWLVVIHFGFLFSLGMFTLVLSFLPLFKAQSQLSRNSVRLSILLGSLFSVFFFEMSPIAASLLFVTLLVLDELISKNIGIGTLLLLFAGHFLGLFILAVLVASVVHHLDPFAFWHQFIQSLFLELKALPESVVLFRPEETPESFQFVLWNFPFIVLSLLTMLIFFSVFFASKLKWMEGSALQLDKIESFTWPKGLPVAFLVFLAANLFLKKHGLYLSSGVFYFLAALMFIQGFLTLHQRLNERKIPVFAKVLIYGVSFLFAFYVLIGLGAVSPWIKERRKSL